VYHTVRTLIERGHEVHMLCMRRAESHSEIESLRELASSLSLVTPSITLGQKLKHLATTGWLRPWTLGQRTFNEMRAKLKEICQLEQIEIVHFAWTEMGQYLKFVPDGIATILATFDVEYLVRPREVSLLSHGPRRFEENRRAKRLTIIEQLSLRQADAIVVCSTADRSGLLGKNPDANIHVVPPWFNASQLLQVGLENIDNGRLTFVGAMDRIANIEAAKFLIKDVWPIVAAEKSDTTLRIVGANPPDFLSKLADKFSRVEITGFVHNLTEEWRATDVAVSPSLIGGGMLVKVAQPMAAGRPVVTTTLGNQGIGGRPGIEVEIGDTPTVFAEAVLRLLDDRQHWLKLSKMGRKRITTEFNWDQAVGHLEVAYASALEHRDRQYVG
jgi:glycosyltransferase involved in cell wall biosynthesis